MLAKIVCLSVVVAVVSAVQKVPVSVYYESLCPDSIAFVTKQLVPAYNTRLKNYMDLTLVPYGKATHSKSPDGHGWEFKCHHGPVECYGNKVHGCVLKQVRNEDDQIKYIDCLMRHSKTHRTLSGSSAASTRNHYPLEDCVSGGDLGLVTACANGTTSHPNGDDILAENGAVTARLNPPLSDVPTVVFDDVYKQTDHDMALTHFRKVLCSYLKGRHPSECSSASLASVSVLALSLAVFLLL